MKNNQELEHKYQIKKLASTLWFFVFLVCVYFMQMYPNIWTILLMIGTLVITIYYYLQYGKLKKQVVENSKSKNNYLEKT